MQVISNFSLKKFGKTQKTGVSYSVLLLIDSYLSFSGTNIFYLIFISINSKIAKKKNKKKKPILNQICKKIAPTEKTTVIRCVLQNNTPLN